MRDSQDSAVVEHYVETRVVHPEVAKRLRRIDWRAVLDDVELDARVLDRFAALIGKNLRTRGEDVPEGTPLVRGSHVLLN